MIIARLQNAKLTCRGGWRWGVSQDGCVGRRGVCISPQLGCLPDAGGGLWCPGRWEEPPSNRFICSEGSRPPCCEKAQAALGGRRRGEELRPPAIDQHHLANSHVTGADPPALAKPSDETTAPATISPTPSWEIRSQNHIANHPQISDPQKLYAMINIYCCFKKKFNMPKSYIPAMRKLELKLKTKHHLH